MCFLDARTARQGGAPRSPNHSRAGGKTQYAARVSG